MPKTKGQKVVFSILISFAMVYGMEVYNSALRNGGMTNAQYLLPVGQVLLLMLAVIVLEGRLRGSWLSKWQIPKKASRLLSSLQFRL